MADEEKQTCSYCGEIIDEKPVPMYHGKSPEGQPKMYRHKDCPKETAAE